MNIFFLFHRSTTKKSYKNIFKKKKKGVWEKKIEGGQIRLFTIG